GAFTEYWSGTMKLPPGSDAYNLMLTADVTGSKAGLPFSLKLNDHNTPSKNITFNGVVGKAGVFQQIGGRLSLASSVSSSFDYASSNGYSIILAFNPGPAWDLGTNTLTIDNVVLQTVARSGTNYTQGFDAPGATPSSVGWNGGFAYSGGSGATKAITQTGVGGSGALVTSVNVTDPANLGAFTEYWSGTMKLPNNSTSNSLFLTAQVTANQSGVPFSLRFNDHGSPTSHYITFTGTIGTAGVFQTVGGRLADASSVDSNFDFASTNGYSLMLTFNPSANWAAGTATLTIDNVVLQTVTPVAGFPVNLAKGPSQAVLTWPTKAGQDYAVQFQDALTGSGWFNLASPVRAAGTTTSYTNSTTDVASRFYRIEVQ
ncbi:MAG TPA: hypothetical protein VNT26_24220, partial [Candidatus Sulfotelmatobacter sp.]|nr:hypothetical protein [Candidatus Sulfotelmatobacter sp.]